MHGMQKVRASILWLHVADGSTQARFPGSCGEAGTRRAGNRLVRGNLVRYRGGRNSRVT